MAEKNFLTYKGFPVVRSGNIVYVGSMGDKYVVMLRILNSTSKGGLELSGDILIQMMNTDPTTPPTEMVVKKANKNGIFNAVDLAAAWLETALRE